MRASRGMKRILCASLIVQIVLAACSKSPPPVATPSAARAPESVAADTVDKAASHASEPPAESGLAIKRGIVMLAQDRMTFRPCDDQKAELWVVDQTDGVLHQAFASEGQGTPVMLYVEAYGERAPLAAEDPAEARAYAGTFVLEEALFAGVQGEGRGCEAPMGDYIVMARGNEPFWAAVVNDERVTWRQPGLPQDIDLGAPQTQDAEGAAHYRAAANGHQLELLVDSQTCRDTMSGEFFAYSAKATFDGKEFTGCARVGGK
jgi:uncharacterized membrane protein